jgi:tetratricopeptide (TPR) repeat protein
MQLANRSLAVAERSGDEYHAALSLTLAAHEHYRAKQYNEAEACLQQSWAKSHRLGDIRNMARVLTCRGNLAWAKGQRTAAIAQYYSPALATYQSLKDPRGTATSMMNIAAVSSELGKYDEAIAFNNEAEALLRKLQRSSNAIYCANICCCVKIWAGAYEEARSGLMDCLNEARSIGDDVLVAECLADLCLLSRVSGDLLGARRNFAALEASSADGIAWPLYRAANDLAEAELAAGNHSSAIARFSHASESLNIWNDKHLSTGSCLNIMLAAIRLGDDGTVTANMRKLRELKWIPFAYDMGNNHGLFEQLAALFLEVKHFFDAMRTLAVAARLRLLTEIEMPIHMRRTHDRLLALSLDNATELEYQLAREDADKAVLATADDVSAMFYRELNSLEERYAALKQLS